MESDFEDDGWDVRAVLVDKRWVDRTPRRPDVEPQLRREVALMPWLAPQLPRPVPIPIIVDEQPLRVRHELIVGAECSGARRAHGESMGAFVAALHRVDIGEATELGVPSATEAHDVGQKIRDRFVDEVIPMLPVDTRPLGRELVARSSRISPTHCVTHHDLGPNHVRVRGATVSGVIDWGDVVIGDPAIDLAWLLYGTKPSFAAGVARSYPVSDALAHRALDWHRLGPWHQVLHGIDHASTRDVAAGIRGVLRRLG